MYVYIYIYIYIHIFELLGGNLDTSGEHRTTRNVSGDVLLG